MDVAEQKRKKAGDQAQKGNLEKQLKESGDKKRVEKNTKRIDEIKKSKDDKKSQLNILKEKEKYLKKHDLWKYIDQKDHNKPGLT